LNTLFDRALIVIKNLQNPALGTIAATTNPFAYGYKNWVRDASIVAIALDATGHHDEADRYWRWMATQQKNDGTWATHRYGTWPACTRRNTWPRFEAIRRSPIGMPADRPRS
jgi:GH15 family glucan-1,4-alpha-glucosidase